MHYMQKTAAVDAAYFVIQNAFAKQSSQVMLWTL